MLGTFCVFRSPSIPRDYEDIFLFLSSKTFYNYLLTFRSSMYLEMIPCVCKAGVSYLFCFFQYGYPFTEESYLSSMIYKAAFVSIKVSKYT